MVNDPGYETGKGFTRGVNKKEATRERERLFDIIRELVKWENTNNEEVLERARAEIRKSWQETCDLNKKHPHAAALFTTNRIVAAPIFFNQAILARNREKIHAVLINAGYANAGTGPTGLTHAVESAKIAADELEVPRDSVLLAGTGRIGVQLPMELMRSGIRRAVSELDSGGGRRAALAILSNDSRAKDRAMSISLRAARSDGSCSSARAIACSSDSPFTGSTYCFATGSDTGAWATADTSVISAAMRTLSTIRVVIARLLRS